MTKRKILMTAGAKGGSGKSTTMISLADFFHVNNIPVSLVDADVENRHRGSLANVFKDTPKVDIRTRRGLDDFVERVLSDTVPLVLADLGAGSGRDTFSWFDEMHDPLKDSGISFVAIGVVTGEAATVDTLFNWARTLKARVEYLVVRNHRNGDDFGYLENSDPGKQFFKLAKPAVIDLESRIPDIQEELGNRGLSLRQAMDAPNDIAGPLLSKFTSKVRMRGYINRIEAEFKRVSEVLLP